MLELKAKKRDKKENLNALKREGYIPAVYYGRTQASTPITIPKRDFEKIWQESGESAVVTLKDDSNGSLEALIHDVDIDPIYNTPRHVDFYVFEEGRTIEVSVPLEFVGVAPVVKEQGAMLVKVLRELNVDAMPRSIPNHLEVDVSSLKSFDDQILAKDITLPKDVYLKDDPEEVIAAVTQPEEEVETEEEESVDFSAIEVEKKGKEEEEEAASDEE
ncbi:MAG: 50S ribosomal protein L25 [Candidatus Paceibacterota bacterium]